MRGSEHKQFWCTHPGCEKVFNRRDYLERHATNHLKVKPYMCVQCNRHFSRKDLFDNHLTTKRHARVTHEVEQANYENRIGQLGDPMAGAESSSAGLDSADLCQQTPLNISNNRNHSFSETSGSNALPYAANPTNLELSPTSTTASRRNDFERSGLSMYAPPKQQPLYLSGPGPGPLETSEDINNSNAFYFDDNNRYSYDSLGMDLGELADGATIPRSSGDIDLPWMNQYLGVSSSGNVPSLGSQSQASLSNSKSFGSLSGNSLTSLSGATIPYNGVGTGPASTKYDSPSASARFSSYGVSLGLNNSNATFSTNSDGGSTSDEYTSDVDGTSAAAIVGDRLRKDMADNLSLKNLRECLLPPSSQNIDVAGTPQHSTIVANDSSRTSNFALENNESDDNNESSDRRRNSSIDKKNAQNPMEVVVAVTGDARYAWFFDDVFDTEKAKLGYDRCFSDAIDIYQRRADELTGDVNQAGTNEGNATSTQSSDLPHVGDAKRRPNPELNQASPQTLDKDKMDPTIAARLGQCSSKDNEEFMLKYPNMMKPSNHDRAEVVMSILRDMRLELTSSDAVGDWIQSAMVKAEPVFYILHPATFDPNTAHYSLLVVLTLIGMALSQDRAAASAARRAFAPGFLYAYESLVQIPNNLTPSKLDLQYVNILQAFSSSSRYERLISLGDGSQVSFTKNSPGNWATNLFLNKVLSAVPHVGEFSTPSKHQPIWATISSEGYLFHEGADPDVQWREWSILEAVKRVAHFSMYCDSIATLSTRKPNPISIFNMDIHMICPEPAWQAKNREEFFHIFGNSGIISNVPYLGLIKSSIRFPRMAQKDDFVSHDLPQIGAPWSLFASKVVAHGLIMIVGRLSGLIPHSDEMSQAVIQSRTDVGNGGDIFSKLDRKLQARLYRGLDVWYHHFSAVYGDVTDKILKVSGSMSLPLREEFDPTQVEDDQTGVPRYALIIILCHYSSLIFVHEDLPIVLQVTANLKMWLEGNKSISLDMLLDYLYMPLYTNWIRTDEAKGMVSACSLYSSWHQAIAGNVVTGNHMFLSAMIYISVIVVWLYDCASHEGTAELAPLRLDDFQFMDDAVDYLHGSYKNVCGQASTPPKRGINSLSLMAACLSYKRKSTAPLVKMIIQSLSVMDPAYSTDKLFSTVKKSSKSYDERVAKTKEAMSCNTAMASNEEDESLSNAEYASVLDDAQSKTGSVSASSERAKQEEIPTEHDPLEIESPRSIDIELDSDMGNVSDSDLTPKEVAGQDFIAEQAVDKMMADAGI